MKAKDTLMDIDKYLADMGWIISKDGMQYAWLKQGLEAQAEISFKAGHQACAEEMSYILPAKFKKARQAGIKEVVEWIKRHKCYTENIMIVDGESLQVKLKEWGLEL